MEQFNYNNLPANIKLYYQIGLSLIICILEHDQLLDILMQSDLKDVDDVPVNILLKFLSDPNWQIANVYESVLLLKLKELFQYKFDNDLMFAFNHKLTDQLFKLFCHQIFDISPNYNITKPFKLQLLPIFTSLLDSTCPLCIYLKDLDIRSSYYENLLIQAMQKRNIEIIEPIESAPINKFANYNIVKAIVDRNSIVIQNVENNIKFAMLPNDIIHQILLFFSPLRLSKLMQISSYFYSLIKLNSKIWFELYNRIFLNFECQEPDHDWKKSVTMLVGAILRKKYYICFCCSCTCAYVNIHNLVAHRMNKHQIYPKNINKVLNIKKSWFIDTSTSIISEQDESQPITIHYYDLESSLIEDETSEKEINAGCLKKANSSKYYSRCKAIACNQSILNLNLPLKASCDFIGDEVDLFSHYLIEHSVPKKSLKKVYKLLHSNVKEFLFQNYDFQCAWGNCGRRYLSLSDLQIHYQLHSNIPLKICNFPNCKTVFKTDDYLLMHKIQFHNLPTTN